MFIFKLTEKQQILLPLINNLSFVYNGNFVTHRQAYKPVESDATVQFFNLSSYGNQNFFNHLRKTFQRHNNN